jgi:mevalonate kinase
MPAISATAPGKIILFGEHAVVYGRPAIAIPLQQVSARVIAMAEPRLPNGIIHIQAADIGLDANLGDLPDEHPLAIAIRLTLAALSTANPPAMTLRVTSTIPQAAGLGSGAAVSVALIRAVSAFLGQPLANAQVSALALEVEKHYHGTPSGIDNTVITFNQPVYFTRGLPIEIFRIAASFHLVVGDTGVRSLTSLVVGDLRQRWQVDPGRYEALFDEAGSLAAQARELIEGGHPEQLGALMNKNHALLQEMDVSSPELDRLVEAARAAGALGAKLSGGGRGGNMIALVEPDAANRVAEALRSAGAVQTLTSVVR